MTSLILTVTTVPVPARAVYEGHNMKVPHGNHYNMSSFVYKKRFS